MTIRLGSPDFLRMFRPSSGRCSWTTRPPGRSNPAILRRVAEIRASVGGPSGGENWQSGHALHRLDEFRDLVEAIRATTRKVLSFLEIASDDFEITGCWANVNGIGASLGVHTHPNNFLSGVYYVQTQPGADTINFHDPRVQTAIIRPPVKALTADNTDQVVVRVREGTLLLFPAWLPHSVDPNKSARERISISFNIMFSAFAATLSPPLWGGNS